MRKMLTLLVIIVPLFILGILILKKQNTSPQKSSAFDNTASISGESISNTVVIDGLTYSWHEITDIDNLNLIPNFDQKLSASEIRNQHKCSFIANAGFYSKDNKPIGLFIADGSKQSDWQDNVLFDGLLSINDMATPRITRDIPRDHLRLAVQSGPILKENSFFQNLRIQNDKPSRRLIAGVTGENKLYFVIIYDAGSEYSGPELADLPGDIKNFEKESGILFADVINLDGGSASTFMGETTKLSELNSVGAFFCQL